MSLRFTVEQAKELFGYDPGEDGGSALPQKPRSSGQPSGRIATGKRTGGRNPQAELLTLVKGIYSGEIIGDYKGAVPGRKFEIDIALVDLKIGIEVDGWEYHGKHKSDFHRDREKRNRLVVEGWAILAFSARTVFKETGEALSMIERLISDRSL